MTRRPFILRCALLLVAAWYATIASGQLSLAEGLLARQHAGQHDRSGVPATMQPMLMGGMQCSDGMPMSGHHRHICLCIDTGCASIGVALHVAGPRVLISRYSRSSETPTAAVVSSYALPEHTLPFATAPPAHM